MNLSEVHSLSPAFPDVDERFMRAYTEGGLTIIATGQKEEYKKVKLKPPGS